MKKAILFAITSLYLSVIGFSQSQKMVLVEHFTNASCGPCAAYNPTLQAILDDGQNSTDLTSIKYQWYFPGFDPMHNHNPGEANNRTAHYGINGVPTSVVGGNSWQGNPANITQSHIDTLKGNTSPFEITLSHDFNDNMDEIEVTMKIKATGAVTANLLAHIVVIEKEINFTSAPGTNGETEFHNVMKKMLPNENGNALPATMNVGDSVVLFRTWKLANIYDYNELAVVGFVQNGTNSHVYQAGYSAPITFTPKHALNIQMIELSNIPEETCKSSISPEIEFRNAGSTAITSAEFAYTINGGAPQTISWSGNAGFDKFRSLALGELTYSLIANNDFEIYVTSVNGSADGFNVGDSISQSFIEATEFHPGLEFDLIAYTDADKISWKILNSNDDVIAQNTPYEDGVASLQYVSIPAEDCYLLDFKQDISGSKFSGVLVIKDATGETLFSSIYGEKDVEKSFTVDATFVSIENTIEKRVFSIFPNPSNEQFSIVANEKINATLTDIAGRQIENFQLNAGEIKTISNLNSGLYFLKSGKRIEKVIVK